MAFNIWRITDGKAGHDSQSTGLCNAIEKLQTCQRYDISADSLTNSGKNLLLKQIPRGIGLPDPQLIIGAGHGTHLTMLSAKRARGGKTIVLMQPSLPSSFFDVCIIPKHDSPGKQANVITTHGALNPIQFNDNKLRNTGLILLGGPSKHFQWDNESILTQIKQIIANTADINWTIADSPRTPKIILDTLHRLIDSKINILNVTKTDSESIREYIFKSKYIWISADSISMIYESLASGASVGLLDLEQNKQSRVAKAIKALIDENQLTTFKIWDSDKKVTIATMRFNEAERCALLLDGRGLLA